MKRISKISRYWRTVIVLLVLGLLLSVLCFFPAACDWYTEHIYSALASGLTRLNGLLPFALGEIMMYLGILMLLFSVIFLLLLIFLRKKQKYKGFCKGWFKTFLMMGVCVLFLYVPLWLVPFFGNVMGQNNSGKRTEYDAHEVTALYVHIINGLNEAAEEIEISPEGKVQFYSSAELTPLISEAMNGISDDYPRLSGYYPEIKTLLCSDILERMGIGGFNFPFTAEPVRNKYIRPDYLPVLTAHELAHHKGFFKENEGNLASQLALAQSSEPLLRFSAYMDMLSYIEPEWEDAVSGALQAMREQGTIQVPEIPQIHKGMTDAEKAQAKAAIEENRRIQTEIFGEIPAVSNRCGLIIDAAAGIEQEIYAEDPHPIDDMPAVDAFIQETAETGWQTQAAILQDNSYSGVVLLLLQYYDGKLF